MSSLKDEFDKFNLPKGLRIQVYKWGLGGMSTAFSVMLALYIRCSSQINAIRQEQTEDWKELYQEIKVSAREQLKPAMEANKANIQEYKKEVDSLTLKVDTLKKL